MAIIAFVAIVAIVLVVAAMMIAMVASIVRASRMPVMVKHFVSSVMIMQVIVLVGS